MAKAKIFGRLNEKVDGFGGEQLRAWRDGAGLSQAGLAMRLRAMGIAEIEGKHVCQQRIAEMEKADECVVSVRCFRALGAIFGAAVIIDV